MSIQKNNNILISPDDSTEETKTAHRVTKLYFGVPPELANEPASIIYMPVTFMLKTGCLKPITLNLYSTSRSRMSHSLKRM